MPKAIPIFLDVPIRAETNDLPPNWFASKYRRPSRDTLSLFERDIFAPSDGADGNKSQGNAAGGRAVLTAINPLHRGDIASSADPAFLHHSKFIPSRRGYKLG